MKLYNTLTKKVEVFNSIKEGQATIYSCGPTVYDHIHIGNLRAFIMADTLQRALTAGGLTVKQVMNYTDVDDKTISRSAAKFPDESPEEALKALTQHYEAIFMDDVRAIGNNVDAVQFIRATESIAGMQALITELYQKGFAYLADDGVYFSIQKYRDAGKKYGQLLELNAGNFSEARIDNDEYDKESIHDFALWKTKKGSQPAWDFELDGHNLLGRPGWHIECSAMSRATVGQPFDIHTGGVDNIFPHHENEIAQSTALTDGKYANYFVHNEHLLVEGRKMSKSLNNFFTLQDVRQKGFEPIVFRVLVLQAHYRTQLNFSWDNLIAAQNRLQGFYDMAVQQYQTVTGPVQPEFEQTTANIIEMAGNDMDTPQILAEISRITKLIENNGVTDSSLKDFKKYLATVDAILGLNLSTKPNLTSQQEKLLAQRQQARNQKDWATTDALRDQLKADGIAVKDTSAGQTWTIL